MELHWYNSGLEHLTLSALGICFSHVKVLMIKHQSHTYVYIYIHFVHFLSRCLSYSEGPKTGHSTRSAASPVLSTGE